VKRLSWLFVLCQCVSGYAWAQSGTGAISGTVQDSSGAVLPGVTVTLVNPGTVGGAQVAIADARGAYQFARLVPGRYGVRGELQGFRTTVHENVVVNADVTARVDIRLEVGDVIETLTVTGESPVVDTTSTLNQTVLDRTVIAALPSRNDLWGVAKVVPSVILDKYDVGGSEAYGDSIATVHGARQGAEGSLMIDGMEIYCGANGGLPCTYLDPAGYQEINFQAGNAPAESAKGGVAYNLVTRTGTNVFHGGFAFNGTNQHLQSNNITGELRRDLLAGVPARALAANPSLVPGAKILHMFNVTGNASGPIVRDKLWWAATLDYGELDQLLLGSYNPEGTQTVDDNLRKTYSGKISWQISPSHQLHFYELMVQKAAFHRPGEGTTQFYESRALIYQYPNLKRVHQSRWTGVLSPRLLAEVKSSLLYGPTIQPARPEVKPGDIPRFDRVTLVNSVARPTYGWTPQYRFVLQSSLSYVARAHELKFGYQRDHANLHTQQYSMSHYPSGLRAIYRDGVPDSVNTYNTPVDFEQWHDIQSVYAQDKWNPIRKLTISAGLRLQRVVGGMPAACQAQTPFIDAQCFPEIKNVPNFVNLAPRLGVIYDVFGDGRTALKLTANRYLLGLGVEYTGRINAIRLTNDTRAWTDRNNDLTPQLDELGPSSGLDLGTTARYSADTEAPYSNELSVVLEHQLPGALVVSVGYFHHGTRREIGSRNVAIPLESYTPLQVVEKSSGQQVTVYNQDPKLRGKFDTLWDNYPELDSDYNGVEVNVRKRLSNRWMILGGMSYGRSTGDIYGTADLNDPNLTFRQGLLNQDVPLAVKVSGLYELPYGISLSASAQHANGFPERTTVSVGRDTVALTQVTQSLLVSPAGTTRLPSVNVIDLSVRKSFRSGGLKFEPVVDLFNIGNINTITFRTTQLGPAYNRVLRIFRGRMVKVGFNIDF